MTQVIRFIETHGKLIALVFLAGAIYARSEFMLASAVKEIEHLAKAMHELKNETVSLRIEVAKITTEISYLSKGIRLATPESDSNQRNHRKERGK